jgi:hypothetical protein
MLKAVPTSLGLLCCALISFIFLYILFGKAAKIELIRVDGEKQAIKLLCIVTFLYLIGWITSIVVGQTIFNLSLTPLLSLIAAGCILLPYFVAMLTYLFGYVPTW